jgi:hypothetical protein
MGGDRLSAVAAPGNLDHHFRDMPDGAHDRLDVSGQQLPPLPGKSASAAVPDAVLKPPVVFKYSEPFVRSGVQVVPWDACRGPPRLICQTHDECQRDVEAPDVFVVKMPDQTSDTFAPNRHGLIGHYLRSHS